MTGSTANPFQIVHDHCNTSAAYHKFQILQPWSAIIRIQEAFMNSYSSTMVSDTEKEDLYINYVLMSELICHFLPTDGQNHYKYSMLLPRDDQAELAWKNTVTVQRSKIPVLTGFNSAELCCCDAVTITPNQPLHSHSQSFTIQMTFTAEACLNS